MAEVQAHLPPIPEGPDVEASLVVVEHAPMAASEHQHDALPAPEPATTGKATDKATNKATTEAHRPSGDAPHPKQSSALARVDHLAAHLHRCLQTPAGVDSILLLLCYSTRLSAAVINSILQPSPQMMSFISRLMTPFTSSAASGGSSAVVKRSATAAAAPSTLQLVLLRALSRVVPGLTKLAARLKTVSALTSEARTFSRLWSLLGLYLLARKLAKEKATSELDRAIGWAQVVSCVGLSVLEGGAFLSQKKIMGWSPEKQVWAFRWSTRFWTAYVGVELARLAVERVRVSSKRVREVAALPRPKGGDGDEDEDETQEAARLAEAEVKEREHWAWEDRWRGNVLRNLAWAPLTVHWSLEKGFVSDAVLSMLGCIPGIVQTRQLWKDTA